jgi:hypothetical protein
MRETIGSRRILLIWELGGAMGHLVRLLPIARGLLDQGHSVSLALRSTPRHALVPGRVPLLPIPVLPASRQPIAQPVSIADILHNIGISDGDTLAGQARALRGLVEAVGPDAIVLDYSPTALLALQGMKNSAHPDRHGLREPAGAVSAAQPAGVAEPLPGSDRGYRGRSLRGLERAARTSGPARAGQYRRAVQPTRLERPRDVPGARPLAREGRGEHGSDYVGTWGETLATEPVWPDAEGPKVFVYLKPFRGLRAILDELARRQLPSLVYIGGPFDSARWDDSSVRISSKPLNMREAASQCDLAILNAGHGTTAAMLLAGVPLLQLPIQTEQYHNAEASARLGAGLRVDLGDQDDFLSALERLLSDPRYRDHDPESAVEQIVDGIIQRATSKT